MKLNNKRKFIAIVIIFAVLVFALYNVFYYSYWSRRHSILYDVKTVYVVPDADNDSLYHLEFDVDVKRWHGDTNVYKYTMYSDIVGMPDYWIDDDNIPTFQLDGSKANFQIECTMDLRNPQLRTNDNYKEFLDAYILELRFSAIDEEGNRIESAELYMQDNKDVEIIYK